MPTWTGTSRHYHGAVLVPAFTLSPSLQLQPGAPRSGSLWARPLAAHPLSPSVTASAASCRTYPETGQLRVHMWLAAVGINNLGCGLSGGSKMTLLDGNIELVPSWSAAEAGFTIYCCMLQWELVSPNWASAFRFKKFSSVLDFCVWLFSFLYFFQYLLKYGYQNCSLTSPRAKSSLFPEPWQ